MAKTTVAALAAEVATLTHVLAELAQHVQAIEQALETPTPEPKPKPSRKPKAASVKDSKAAKKEANKLAHRQFNAFYGRGEAAKAKAAIPASWREKEYYATRLAEIS
jgi:hypothetical protein